MDTSTLREEILERKKVKKKLSKAQMQLAIIKKKQCDAKALTIVEQLLEPKIDSDWLLDNLKHINKSHMEDVIEERGIIKLCGYVLCSNTLKTIIEQQYYISTKKNKVYDVTKRKNFCSSRCYGASNYLLQQMLTSPLWLRDKEEIPVFKVLPAKDQLGKSIPGDEIQFNDTTVILNSNNKDEPAESNTEVDAHDEENAVGNSETVDTKVELNISEMLSASKEESSKKLDEFGDIKNVPIDSKGIIDNVKQCMDNDDDDKKMSTLENSIILDDSKIDDPNNLSDAVSINKDADQSVKNDQEKNNVTISKQDTNISNDAAQKMGKIQQNKHKRKSVTKEKQSSEFYNLAMHIEHSIKGWITEDTISLLSGEEDTKTRLLENIIQHDRYLHLCKKLNKLQLEDEKDDNADVTKNTLKPLPNLSVLQEEGQKMELKVRAFYKGSTIVENPKNTTNDVEQGSDLVPVLPLIDSHAPKALRRRIFLDKLNRILPDLLRALASNKLPQYIYSNEKSALIKALVNTFSLSATNIIFKTAEWTLVGLVIIKMLSMIDPQLKFLLSSKQASMYISMILMSYKLDPNYLNRLVMELTNIKISNIDNTINL
ncbi:LOW QUALITY PROTEIN: putative RNA polymerase II subunit B1 CTD phosphatase RPAP2 [Osmia bicornis bicornis]|uniref:LOW QUALITY PROTEIN: putative RNA polymerase II subunit B1 CTD phosphatase RPAP2 n=1 Tax=Osmia bicornis bicornis TaxID=1437191 RepID=UPI001EAF423A|nr:LOW QUALITY PROTEIN: putative RNA polymerase II subunit B1 CTD phosphatase RPAP2 [Osmia bicornis bicornis]